MVYRTHTFYLFINKKQKYTLRKTFLENNQIIKLHVDFQVHKHIVPETKKEKTNDNNKIINFVSPFIKK